MTEYSLRPIPKEEGDTYQYYEECAVCHQEVPLDEFKRESWERRHGEPETYLMCEFCASTCSNGRPIDDSGQMGMAILFHEIRALRAALRSTTREA